MIKYALPAAMAALTLGAPAIALAQATQPMPITTPTNPAMNNTSTTVPVQPQAGAATYGAYRDGDGQFVQPMIQPPDMAPVVALPPGAVWVPGQYNWDPAAGNYVWAPGQFVLPPHPNAQWVAGHWQQTPSSWIWLDGRWN